MAREKIVGACHICGHVRDLSFEHVPPRAAFNNRPLRMLRGLEILADEHNPERGQIQQRGSGAYTLCGRCNNETGSWYGPSFAEWVIQGVAFLPHAQVAPSLYLTFRIFPLRVIKQIVCMFFSVNTARFREKHPYLEKFVMDRCLVGLPPEIQIFCFLAPGPRSRQAGVTGATTISTGEVRVLSELTFPPFGYVMCFGSSTPDERLVDITMFATARPNDRKELHLRLPVLPIYTAYPGDYRSPGQILLQT